MFMAHKGENVTPKGLVGGGLRSTSPTSFHMWLIQWAPGSCLVGWPLAALAVPADQHITTAIAFILSGMLLGVMLWGLIALSSLPLFFAIRPRIDHPGCRVTRWHGAAFAAAGLTPLVLIVIALSLALIGNETNFRAISTKAWVALAISGVGLGLGTFVAAEMWRLVLQPHQDTRRSQLIEPLDITPAVRVKEDLEVLRIMLANAAMGLLSFFVLLVVPSLVLLVLLVAIGYIELPQPVQWVQFVPSAVLAFVLFPLIGLASYQIGLWQFVSVRTSGVLLFAGTFFLVVGHSFEPFQELHVGSQVGYSAAAWVYTGVLWALTVPLFVLTGSIFRMSRRLTLLRVDLEPVVRGWRAWPTDLWTHALRTLCLPSFLMALPQGRARPTLLFALAAVVSALHTGLLFSYLTQAPSVLGFIVRTALREESDAVSGRVFPTVGAAITAVSPMQLSGIAPSNIILALPFVFVLILFVVATWLSQKVAASLVRRAQRRAALGYQMVIRQDTRRPILFLRPFREDERLFEPPANSLIAKILAAQRSKTNPR